MSSIETLQKAIYSNLDTLRDLYKQAEGLKGAIEQVDSEPVRKQLVNAYNEVIETLDNHVDTTDALIQALKKALKE